MNKNKDTEVLAIIDKYNIPLKVAAKFMGIGYQSFLHKKKGFNNKSFNQTNLDNLVLNFKESLKDIEL